MSLPRLSRRAVLRGGAGTALALPLLEAMLPGGSAGAQPFVLPKRFVVVAVGNGTYPEMFWPTVGGKTYAPDYVPVESFSSGSDALETTGHTLGPIMQPLIAHQKDLLILEGIDNLNGLGGHRQYAALLANQPASDDRGPTGPTADQVLAKFLTGQTRFPSLQFGVHNGDQDNSFGSLSWYGEGMRAPAENNPYQMFERLFGELPGAGATPNNQALELLRAQRKSVLDLAVGRATALQSRLGSEDRAKLQNYLESMRSVEMQLTGSSSPVAATCKKPDVATGLDWNSHESAPEIAKVQIDQLVMSLACDLTRVATLQIFQEGHSNTHPWLGINIGYHSEIAHRPNTDREGQALLVKIGQWHASLVAYLIEKLKTTPEGSGSLLDNTLVLYVNGLTRGNEHSNANQPTLVAGNLAGKFKTGRYLRFKREGMGYPMGKGKSYGDFLVEVMRVMGMDVNTFGDPTYMHGGMPEILA